MNNRPVEEACAACKYRRKRCGPDCPLAPYFPAHRTQDYLNVNRIFGATKVINRLRSLPPHLRASCVDALIFNANARVADPIGGAYGLIQQLEARIAESQARTAALEATFAAMRMQNPANVVLVQEMAAQPQQPIHCQEEPQNHQPMQNPNVVQEMAAPARADQQPLPPPVEGQELPYNTPPQPQEGSSVGSGEKPPLHSTPKN